MINAFGSMWITYFKESQRHVLKTRGCFLQITERINTVAIIWTAVTFTIIGKQCDTGFNLTSQAHGNHQGGHNKVADDIISWRQDHNNCGYDLRLKKVSANNIVQSHDHKNRESSWQIREHYVSILRVHHKRALEKKVCILLLDAEDSTKKANS